MDLGQCQWSLNGGVSYHGTWCKSSHILTTNHCLHTIHELITPDSTKLDYYSYNTIIVPKNRPHVAQRLPARPVNEPWVDIDGVSSLTGQSIRLKKLRSSSTKQSILGLCWTFPGNRFVVYSWIDMPKIPSSDPNSGRLGNEPTLLRYLPKFFLVSCLPGLALDK